MLLVGLGNPGERYAMTRHNVGFMVVDEIAKRYCFDDWFQCCNGLICMGKINEKNTILLKPMTYMNTSGKSVVRAVRQYDLVSSDVVVFHDELDLTLGRVKQKFGEGHIGHNGVKSVKNHIGYDFTRVRIGIDHPGDKDMVIDHVLSDFLDEEMIKVKCVINGIVETIDNIM